MRSRRNQQKVVQPEIGLWRAADAKKASSCSYTYVHVLYNAC